MYRKAIYLVVAFFCLNVALSGLTSCQPGCGSDHCNIPRCLRTGVISLTAKDGTFDDPIINAGEPVLATNLHFELLVTGNIEVCYQQPGRKTYSLFSSAYACSPAPCRTYFGADSIVSCAIYSNNSYDSLHPAGTTLNDIISSEDFGKVKLYDYDGAELLYHFRVMNLPADTGTHIFTFVLAQQDGDIDSLTVAAIKLLK